MSYTPIDSTVLTGVLNNQGTQATSALQTLILNNQGTQATSALQTTGNSTATVVMNSQGTQATEATQANIYNALGTLAVAASGTRAVLYDESGNPVEVVIDTDNKYHLAVSLIQDVKVSALNSTNVALGASGSYTGLSETTLGVAGIQVSMKTDQNTAVYVDQSADGTNWDVTDDYGYITSKPFGVTVQAVSNYYRVRAVNARTIPQTYLRLNTALCPVIEAVPRTLSDEGNLKVEVYGIESEIGDKVYVSQQRELKTATAVRLAGQAFSGSILDANFWGSAGVSSGVAAQGNGQLTLSTGSSANGLVRITSSRSGRFVAGNSNYYRGVIQCPAASGSNIRRWGAFSTTDGFFFERDGTNFSCVSRLNSVDTRISTGSFNGDLGATFTPTSNVEVFDIYYAPFEVVYYIDNELLHRLPSTTAPLSSTMTLPVGLECNNLAGNTANNTLQVRVSSISRLGDLYSDSFVRATAAATSSIFKYGAGKLHRIVFTGIAAGSVAVYDNINASGVAFIDLTLPTGAGAFVSPFSLEIMANFYTGMTVVTTANVKATWIYE